MHYKDLKFEKGTKFLITGGAGFIGSNLAEAILGMGYEVRVLDDLSTGNIDNINMFINNPNYEFVEGDIRNLDTCIKSTEGINYVLHQAAWGSVPRSIEMPLFYEEVNIKGTLNMLEASRINKVKKFVFASSSSVYGDHPKLPKVEGYEGNLLSPYALTKMVNEEYAKQYTLHYGLDTIGLRYFNVFGKRQNPNGAYAAVIPKFINQLLNNETPVINGDGLTSRDFTYIENVIEANLKACLSAKKSSGKSYNIAYGGRITLNDLYSTISTKLNVGIKPIYNKERAGDIKHSNADITYAKEMLGYNPKFDFNDGIEETIKWFKEMMIGNNKND